jgi:GalNAc-alpha-(1->4)-GalNAc-alpha-(1->3)-diNAcBac-PP-undecaprenol alpha-1,4-N-acetyl-D-galactosaminyltransferase
MERVMAILLQHFSQHEDLEIHLLLIGRKREVLQDIPGQIRIHKPSWSFNNRLRTWHTLKTLVFIRQKAKSVNPDVVLSFGEMWNNLVLIALVNLPYPVYISDRSEPEKDLGRLQNWLRDKLYPSATGYIAQTEQARKVALKNEWNGNVRVIGNPISQVICPHEAKEKMVLSVGRLIPTKHFDRLIHVFQKCQAKEWKLVIVGGDAKKMQLSRQLELQVRELSMKDQIMLEGAQQDVRHYYCRSTIFAFMSTSEGFPNALAEAMAAGCACIAYDCIAGPSDIIDDGINGFLIPEGDENLYISKLKFLMEDANLRQKFGEAAQVKMKKFEASKIAKRFYDFITEGL